MSSAKNMMYQHIAIYTNAAIAQDAATTATESGRTKILKLNDFLKVLDTIEPIKVYLDGCEDKEYKSDEMPEWYKDLELTDVYVDEEGLGVAIYTA